jgi:iron complex outermembrane recepter protein
MSISRGSLLSCAISSILGVSAVSVAQEASRSSALEEIVVTAERRSETLLEVPLSISAYGDKQREQIGILSIQDMANFAPGVSFNMATDRPSIRGIARQSNFFTLDSPVANYFDGVYTSSVQDAQRRPIFTERTEILRGPQGALSGRGSIAGAFNTISKRPTDTWQGEFGTFLGNYMRYGGEGTVSGPLIGEYLRTRVNIGVYKQNEGYFENVSRGDTEGDQPNNRVIADFLFDGKLGESVDYFVKAAFADYDESRHTGLSTETFYAGIENQPADMTAAQFAGARAYSPSSGALTPLASWGFFDAIDGRPVGAPSQNPVILTGDTRKFANDYHSRQKLDNHHNYTMHLTWHTGPVDIRWIGGHQNYRYTQLTDGDTVDVEQMQLPRPSTFPVGAPGRTVRPGQINLYMEEREWYSNELTFTSTTDGPVSWILGLYQSNEDFNQEPATTIFPGYDELSTPFGTVDALLAVLGQPFNPAGIRPIAPNLRGNTSVVGLIDGETISSAAFGQVDWELNDHWKFTVGLRYNKDEKEASEALRYVANSLGSGLGPWLAGSGLGTPRAVDVTPVPVAGAALPRGVIRDNGIDPVTGYRSRDFESDWTAVTGSAGVDFKPTTDDLIYLRFARGYRPGGFNAGFLYDPPMVDKESVDSYEVGYKTTLFERLQLSTSVFYYDYRDIQLPLPTLGRCTDPNDLSTCTTLNSFVNLPKAESRGVEIEINYAATDHLGFYLTYGYLDTEIKEGLVDGNGFTNPDDPAAILPNANRYQVIPGQFDTGYTFLPRYTQDLTGNALANSPEHRVAFNTSYTFELSPGNLTLSGTWIWRDEQNSDVFETAPAIVPSYDTISARLLWVDASDRYTVILYGNNLTDEDAPDSAGATRHRTGLATQAAPGAQGQAYYQTLNLTPPREYGVELQYRFGN